MGPTGCFETSVNSYLLTLRTNPEERRNFLMLFFIIIIITIFIVIYVLIFIFVLLVFKFLLKLRSIVSFSKAV